MLTYVQEKEVIEQYILKTLTDLSLPNVTRLKAAIRILMTTDFQTFTTVTSSSAQVELKPLIDLLQHPEQWVPRSSNTDLGKEGLQDHIKLFTLNNLNLLDERTTILPNPLMVEKSVKEGERLKSVVHTTAIHNVMTAAHYTEEIERHFRELGLTGTDLRAAVDKAIAAMLHLHRAAIEGNFIEFIRDLSVPGVNANLANPDGLSLLQIATREGHIAIVKLLLSLPAIKVNLVSNNGWAALHIAARMGHDDIVALLLSHPEIEVNIVNSDGWTPLHWAAWHGHSHVVTELLNTRQIKVNQIDRSSTSALHWAARNGHADVVALLTNAPGIEINLMDNEGKTALYYAIAYDHLACASTLLEAPEIGVNIADMDGLTPLHWAARNGRIDLVNLLLEMPQINIMALDNNLMTPLDWAKHNGFHELVPIMSQRLKKISAPTQALHKFLDFFKNLSHSSKTSDR